MSSNDPLIHRVAGMESVAAVLASALSGATAEVLAAGPLGASDLLLETSARGIKVRVLRRPALLQRHGSGHTVEEMRSAGVEVRVLAASYGLADLPCGVLVVDGRSALVLDDEGPSALLLDQPELVAVLRYAVEALWHRALAPSVSPASRREIADEIHRLTVQVLIAGESDRCGAKRAGVSERTFAGYVAALKAAYGVETRFQLGYAVGSAEQAEIATAIE